MLTVEQTVLQFKSRSRRKVALLSREIAHNISKGRPTHEFVGIGKELIRLSRSLSSPVLDWPDWEKLKFIEHLTIQAGLEDTPPSLENPFFEAFTIIDGEGGSIGNTSHLASKTELNAVDFDSKQRDSSLSQRISALEEAPSQAPPPGFYESVAYKTELHAHANQAVLDQLTQDMLDSFAVTASHIANRDIHVTKAEKERWDAKVSSNDPRLSDARTPTRHSHSIEEVEGLNVEINRIDERINNIPAGERGKDGLTPVLTVGSVSEGEEASVNIDSTNPSTPVISFVLKSGRDGKNFEVHARGLASERFSSDYEYVPESFNYLATDEGKIYARIPEASALSESGWDSGIPFIYSGWTPILGVCEVDAETEVLEVIGFTGGSGTPPVIPVPEGIDPETVRWFIGSSGYVYDVSLARNIRGAKGNPGEDAVGSLVSDGDGSKFLSDDGTYKNGLQSMKLAEDIPVSLSDGKTLGRYVSGDIIPAKGKTVIELMNMIAQEPINPTVTLNSPTPQQEYDQTDVTVNLNWTKVINSLNADTQSIKLERSRDNSSWTELLSLVNDGGGIEDPGTYTDSVLNPTADNRTIYYRLIIEDTIGGKTTATRNISFKGYVAPEITFSVGSQTRERGDVETGISATITRKSPNINLNYCQIQYRMNGGSWNNLGASMAISGSSETIQYNHNNRDLVDADSLEYRLLIVDDKQTTTSSGKSISFRYTSHLGYSTKAALSLEELLGLGSRSVTDSRVRTINGVTATGGKYTYYAYRAGAGNLSNIIMDGASPVLGAFTKLADVTGTNSLGATITMRVYRSNSVDAFNNNSLAFS